MDGSDGIECGYMRAMFEFDLESFFSFFFLLLLRYFDNSIIL